jgi:hybrid cluster-associated redox disulfide protein
MKPKTLDPSMTVDEIMRRWPATIRPFIQNRMLCIGCPIGIFHTVKDACEEHGVEEASFWRELLAAMRAGEQADASPAFRHSPA